MKRFFLSLIVGLLVLSTLAVPTTYAATFRSGDTVLVSDNTEDLYIFGGNIRVDGPVTNDIVAGGGDIAINDNVTNSVIAGGGNITLGGNVGNTVRIAGGNLTISGDITRDLVAAGGSVTITQDASIGRDVLWSGGNLVLNGPVQGNVTINGGNVTLNSTINGNVNGTIGKLVLGPNARIQGNLSYQSEEKAQIASGAVINGETAYKPLERERKEEAQQFITAGAIYKLIADIIISVVLIALFAKALMVVLRRIAAKPAENGAIGFTYLVFFPFAALLLLILIVPGIAAFLAYGLSLLMSAYIAKIFAGWWLMRWWEGRNKKQYNLDWKAGVFGPIVLFLLGLIPFIGWIPGALLFLVTVGAFVMEVIQLMRGHRNITHEKVASKKTK